MKSKDITLLTNDCLVKAMVFPVIVYGCESWTLKKAEHRRIDAFELWCWRRLEIPLDCKEIKPVNPKGNQPWIFIGSTDAKAETAILWLHDQRADSFKNTLMLGKIEGEKWRGRYRMRWLDSITNSVDMNLSKLQEKTGKSGVLQSMESQRVGQDWVNNNVMVLLCPKGIWILIFKPKCT